MLELAGEAAGLLAVATGWRSGVIVVDCEGSTPQDARGGLAYLLDYMDGNGITFPFNTLRASTTHSGMHFFLRYPVGVDRVRSRNRILPLVDVKADGGYVAVPCGRDNRSWASPILAWDLGVIDVIQCPEIAGMPDGVLDWINTRTRVTDMLAEARRSSPPTSSLRDSVRGMDVATPNRTASVVALVEHYSEVGVPMGERDDIFNTLIFLHRRTGITREQTRINMRGVWSGTRRTPDDDFPWEWLEYKIDRVWSTVAPALHEDLRRVADRWASNSQDAAAAPTIPVETPERANQTPAEPGTVAPLPTTTELAGRRPYLRQTGTRIIMSRGRDSFRGDE